MLRKNSHNEENISQLNLVRRFLKKSDISLYDHKFDLIYYHWNSKEPGAFPNVSFMCYHDNSILTISSS